VRRIFLLALVCLLIGSGCRRYPDWYAPPAQRQSFEGDEPPAVVAAMFRMNQADVAQYLVKDVANGPEGAEWRWVFKRPEMRFLIQDAGNLCFFMDFAIPEVTFRQTGPVRFTLFINNQLFKTFRFDQHGQMQLLTPVPSALLKPRAVNHVAIDVDPVWVGPTDGATRGFILSSAGFRKCQQ